MVLFFSWRNRPKIQKANASVAVERGGGPGRRVLCGVVLFSIAVAQREKRGPFARNLRFLQHLCSACLTDVLKTLA